MSKIDDFLDTLDHDEIVAFADSVSSKLESAREAGDIQAFLKIEKILEDRNMDAKDLKELVQLANHVQALRSKKYSDGKGNFWSGRGKRPAWVKAAAGKDGDISKLVFANDDITPLNSREPKSSK